MRKIVFSLTGSILILLIIIAVTGYCKYKPKPSVLEVFVNNQSALVEAGTYSLEKWGREAADDTYSDPVTLVRNDDPIVVGPSEEIMLEFENSPQTVKYYLWDVKTGKLAYKGLKGYPLKLEDSNVESGDYAMEIRAKWENGYVLYNTRIIVYNDAK
ncbi:MAG: hypothetical protein WB217_05970 [Mesobacillus sp.]|uniref:hypothetical protein n=1 Tax=Mesobacillus sp. TaxID=2675271 RepID=UPI003C460687